MLDQTTLPNSPKFSEMDNIIHIDEKWFNATKKNRNFYMLPEEEDPHRTVQNKNAIDKLMFLSAFGKQKTDAKGNIIFNGKIGIWHFVRKVPQHIYFQAMLFFIFLTIQLFLCTRNQHKGVAVIEREEHW
jgi:hypothetical protein